MNNTLLSASSLSIGYTRTTPLCHNISLEAHSGEVVALLGSNGVGKSTLLRTLAGEMLPLAGNITLCGRKLHDISRKQRARMLSIVAHEATMTGALTVKQLVSLGRQPYTGWSGVLSASDRDIVKLAMHNAGIDYKAEAPMASLSDGERQKAMIARALAQDTPVMMLDEPLSFLDPAARIEIFALLLQLAKTGHKAIILSCHDVAMSLRMASRLWLFNADHTLICTSPEEAVKTGDIEHLYNSPTAVFAPHLGDFTAR